MQVLSHLIFLLIVKMITLSSVSKSIKSGNEDMECKFSSRHFLKYASSTTLFIIDRPTLFTRIMHLARDSTCELSNTKLFGNLCH